MKPMVKVLAVALLAPMLGMGAGQQAQAYEEMDVKNGGTLSGHVTLLGEVPKPKGYNLVTFPDPVFCGRISDGNGFRLLQPFDVGPDGQFRNVVLVIEGIERGKAFDYEPPRIEAADCEFEPFITVVRDHHQIEIVNMDPVMHDIQAYETSEHGARVLFNVPLPMNERFTKVGLSKRGRQGKHLAGKVMTQKVRMRRGRNVFVMQCGFHAYMESWGLAMTHPYFDKTDGKGAYTISNIPPGTYKVTAWHPMVSKEFTVTIKPNGTATLDVDFDAPKGRLYANEAQENPRFGQAVLGDVQIKPTVRKQTY